jgi:hypothetical protein
MRKPLLLIIFCSLITGLSAQTLEGIWISSSRMDVQKRTDSTYFEGDEILSKELEKIEIDTFYHNAYALIHFLENREIIFQGIGGKKGLGSYTKALDTLTVVIDTIELKLLNRNENLILLDLDSGWQNSHLIFEKLLPLSSLSKEKMRLDFEKESYWKVKADSNSMNFGYEFHFLDSGHVTLSQFNNEWNASTSWGEYKTAIYENNLFLYILDRHSLDDRMFRIYSDSTNVLFAQNFDDNWGDKPPSKHELQLVRAVLPSKKELKEIKKSLTGVWILDDTVLPFDTAFSEYKRLDEQFYELNFSKNGDFSISYGGVLTNENESTPRSKEIKGTWEVGPTGRYIKMKIDSGYMEYMTLIDVTKKSLSVGMDTESLDFEMTYSHHLIRLKKGANKR